MSFEKKGFVSPDSSDILICMKTDVKVGKVGKEKNDGAAKIVILEGSVKPNLKPEYAGNSLILNS
ncbi:MAG: hypothetical protein DRI57_18320 [Deltaproteobacteria bacterium]|nr:MAG: hypothetical protein DRI57_18320 [Deltaproteobacteria bacterium]